MFRKQFDPAMPHMDEKNLPGPEFHEDGSVSMYDDGGYSIVYERPPLSMNISYMEKQYKKCYSLLTGVIKSIERYGLSINELFGEDEQFMEHLHQSRVFVGAEPVDSE